MIAIPHIDAGRVDLYDRYCNPFGCFYFADGGWEFHNNDRDLTIEQRVIIEKMTQDLNA